MRHLLWTLCDLAFAGSLGCGQEDPPCSVCLVVLWIFGIPLFSEGTGSYLGYVKGGVQRSPLVPE